MPAITMKQLLEAGVHFGHQTRRWNPKMSKYIYMERNGIHIIDLQKTLALTEEAYEVVKSLAKEGKTILFVGTKRQAQKAISEQADRCGMPYVNHRWLGGMLTNWNTIKKRIGRLRELNEMRDTGIFDSLPKKEVVKLTKEITRLESFFAGIYEMKDIPDALFIIDPNNEDIAIKEAVKLRLPIVALVDTNCSPDFIDHIIPGNDDAIRSTNLICEVVANAVIAGKQEYEAEHKEADTEESEPKKGDGDKKLKERFFKEKFELGDNIEDEKKMFMEIEEEIIATEEDEAASENEAEGKEESSEKQDEDTEEKSSEPAAAEIPNEAEDTIKSETTAEVAPNDVEDVVSSKAETDNSEESEEK